MTKTRKMFLVVPFVLIGYFIFGKANSWNLVRTDDGISVYTRSAENSAIKEIQITARTKATLNQTISLLSDVPLYSKWVYKCDTSILLHKISEKEYYYYITLDFPFLFTDRELTVFSTQEIDENGIYRSESVGTTKYAPQSTNYVRIPHFKSQWIISPQKDGQLLIQYFGFSDPGGDIPKWIVNLAIDQGPFNTMKQLLDLLEEL